MFQTCYAFAAAHELHARGLIFLVTIMNDSSVLRKMIHKLTSITNVIIMSHKA